MSHLTAHKQFSTICKQLSELLNKGVSIPQALDIIESTESNAHLKSKIGHARTSLQSGDSFFEAISPLVPAGSPTLLSQSDDTVSLSEILTLVSEFIDTKVAHIEAFRRQLVYPAFLLASLTLCFGVFFIVLIPHYNRFFDRLGYATPVILQVLTYIRHSTALQGGVAAGVLVFLVGFGRKGIEKVIQFFSHQSVFDELWVLGLTLKQGLPLKAAVLRLASSMPDSRWPHLSAHLAKTGDVSAGLSATWPLSEDDQHLVRNGLSTGTLPQSLWLVYQRHSTALNKKRHSVIRFVQPLFLVILSMGIGLIIYLTFSPLMASIDSL